MTQEMAVLNHMETREGITSWEAYERYGITRLSSIIHRIRKRGYKVITKLKSTENRYGNTVNYAVYKLVKAEDKKDESLS